MYLKDIVTITLSNSGGCPPPVPHSRVGIATIKVALRMGIILEFCEPIKARASDLVSQFTMSYFLSAGRVVVEVL